MTWWHYNEFILDHYEEDDDDKDDAKGVDVINDDYDSDGVDDDIWWLWWC